MGVGLAPSWVSGLPGFGGSPTLDGRSPMTEMSPLRRRMIEDMTVRNLSPATQQSYVHAVAKFGRFFGRSPARLGLEEVRAFQVHLVAGGVSWDGVVVHPLLAGPVRAGDHQ